MSIQAISWAFQQDIKPSPLKFILIAFANYTTEYGTTWCSGETMQLMTGMDKKTVVKWVGKLERDGYIKDTGNREGKTGSVKVYTLVSFEAHPKTGKLRSSPNSGREAHPIQDGSSPNSGIPPITPNIELTLKNLKEPKVRNASKITLAQWEKNAGHQICVEVMMDWIKENNLDPVKLKKLMPEFREKMQAAGKLYADYTAVFKVWLRSGWLTLKLDQVRLTEASKSGVTIFDRGNQL